jgi:hypothetical protein
MGCQSPQQTAEKLVAKYLKERLNDWDSYKSVSFSILDSLKSSWTIPKHLENDVFRLRRIADAINALGYNGIGLTNDADYHINIIKKYPREDNEYNKKALELWEEYKAIQNRVYKDRDSFVPQFLGWKIIHKYRARNQYNALTLYSEEIHFDKGLTEITGTFPIEEE